MAYIGREPTIGNFQVCDAISVVNGQAAYTMQVSSVNVVPETANHMIVSLNGVIQAPGSSYTVSGSTITFASNLVTGDVIDFIHILGSVLDLGVPSDSTVSLAKLTATGTKDATTFLRGDNTFAEAGGGAMTLLQAQTASNSATIDFTSNFSTAYDVYRLDIIQCIPTDDAAYFTVALSDDGGSSWGGSGDYNVGVIAYDGSVSYGNHDSNVFYTNGDSGTLQGNAGILESLSGTWYFYGLEDGNHPHVSWQMAYGNVSGEATINIGSGIFQGSTNDIDGIRILYTSAGGNIVSGKFRLYGIKNS